MGFCVVSLFGLFNSLETRYPLCRRLSGSQRLSACADEEKPLVSLETITPIAIILVDLSLMMSVLGVKNFIGIQSDVLIIVSKNRRRSVNVEVHISELRVLTPQT
jgi:hypothetical protein